SRKILVDAGALIPNRTLLPRTSRIFTVNSQSGTKMLSPTRRVRTNIVPPVPQNKIRNSKSDFPYWASADAGPGWLSPGRFRNTGSSKPVEPAPSDVTPPSEADELLPHYHLR